MSTNASLPAETVGEDGMNMGRVFRNAVERNPEATALIDPAGDVEYTYGEWEERVSQVADALAETGVEPGERVAVSMENRAETVTVFWATQLIGASFVPINFRLAADELAFILNNASAQVVWYSDVSRESIVGARGDVETLTTDVYVDENAPEGAVAAEEFVERGDASTFEPTFVDPDEESLILHTSGTTGLPKGVPITHRMNYARTVGNPINLTWRPGEVTLGIMPNFHEMGRAAITSMTLLNGTYVAQRQWSPADAFDLIEEYDISMLYLVPTMFHDIVDAEGVEDADFSGVDIVGYAGTPMSKRVHEEVFELIDPDRFVNFYGTSETNNVTICDSLDEKPGSAGRAGIHTRVRVVEPVEGETVSPDNTVEQGELGEIILDASSPEAFNGYLDRPDADEESFQDGWYFIGDLGYRDEDGDIWIVGRVDDMIISGGENIYPVEVEDVLDGHERVKNVAVVGLEDDRWGQVVTAFVVPDSTDDPAGVAEELDTYLVESDELADFKRPRKYIVVDDIPKSRVGKKLRRELRVDELDDLPVTIHERVDLG